MEWRINQQVRLVSRLAAQFENGNEVFTVQAVFETTNVATGTKNQFVRVADEKGSVVVWFEEKPHPENTLLRADAFERLSK